VKVRQVKQRLSGLRTRQQQLESRYMTPLLAAVAWDPDTLHAAGAYVVLLHSEVERTLESVVRDVLRHAADETEHYQLHPVLLNAAVYFRGEVAQRMHHLLSFVPTRTEMMNDKARLLNCWTSGGARVWYEALITANHGAGMQYIGGLMHPLGVQVIESEFKRVANSRGVALLGKASPAEEEELRKFVALRGAVAHGGIVTTKEALTPHSPVDVLESSRHAVEAIEDVSRSLLKSW
jgi:hypothetical protein